jgi:hypothetical protein
VIKGLNCAFCKHFRERLENGTLTCAAFPNGIPEPIASAKVEHTAPYPGDNGIRFEPTKESALFFTES